MVTKSIEYLAGLPVYAYGYASGAAGTGGVISQKIEYRNSTDEGVHGLTLTTIEYITDLTVNANPITTPAGSTLVSVSYTDQGGYRLWTGVYALGVGRISTDVETKNGGKLVLTTIKYLNTDSGAVPSGVVISTDTQVSDGYNLVTKVYALGAGRVSIDTETKFNGALVITKIKYFNTDDGGAPGGILIDTSTEQGDGYQIISATYAAGAGQISQEIDYEMSPDVGVTGITRYTIKFLSAPSVGSNPITPPGGTVLISVTDDESDGYKLWTGLYASGTGTVDSTVSIRNNGKLVVYSITAIGAAPSAPAPTIGGTVVLIKSEVRNGTRIENGTKIYEYQWAEGEGLVVDESTISALGTLVIYHRLSFGVAPTTPSATIGGTVTLFETAQRQEEGFIAYDYRWAEGKGRASITTRGEADGALVYEVTDYAVGTSTPAYPGSGTAYLVGLEQSATEGHYVNRATYKKPPADDTLREFVTFDMPGLAFFVGTQLTLQPPVKSMPLLASVAVSYGTSQDTTAFFSPKRWASFNETYVPMVNGVAGTPVTNSDALNDYISGGTSGSGGAGTYNGVSVASYAYATTASDPNTLPTGATVIHTNNSLYLTATDGTRVYKRSVTSVTLP